MIDIIRFKEYCMELVAKVNSELLAEDARKGIARLVMGVKEEHLVKKLGDKAGVSLCVNYPDETTSGDENTSSDVQKAYFFLVEKVNPGAETDDEEVEHYASLQHIMMLVREELREGYDSCSKMIFKENYRIEWEYQIFGGFNGLSMSVDYIELA